MATPAEVANDLEAQARQLRRKTPDARTSVMVMMSLERGAATIREMQARIEQLECRPLRDCPGYKP